MCSTRPAHFTTATAFMYIEVYVCLSVCIYRLHIYIYMYMQLCDFYVIVCRTLPSDIQSTCTHVEHALIVDVLYRQILHILRKYDIVLLCMRLWTRICFIYICVCVGGLYCMTQSIYAVFVCIHMFGCACANICVHGTDISVNVLALFEDLLKGAV